MADSRTNSPVSDKVSDNEILLEYQTVGNSVKVTAIDPNSLVEVSIVGPATAGRQQLARAAIDKLRYRLARLSE